MVTGTPLFFTPLLLGVGTLIASLVSMMNLDLGSQTWKRFLLFSKSRCLFLQGRTIGFGRLLDLIWKSRNRALFNCIEADPRSTILAFYIAVEEGRLWLTQQSGSGSGGSPENAVYTCSPPLGHFILHSNGAWNKNCKSGSRSAIIQNSLGVFVGATCSCSKGISAAVLEAEAMPDGLLIAQFLGLMSLLCFSDCLAIVNANNGGSSGIDWATRVVVDDIISLIPTFSFCRFSFVPRSSNREAHVLAKGGSMYGLCRSWWGSPPLALVNLNSG
ncbi:uncharacterized protein LOC122092797 [Macadamia integrifolia]|uniref:uncharacterized protein LOC122092797 n=1 Tax=Macadamia integrifolia TaxID=60698 RepID=UPI001C5277C7|nr:uncharacterized protein LOC122092797 [Macadamia integrifolia]